MPGFLWGPPSEISEFVRTHALGTESIIGVPMRAVTNLLIGFLVFGSALVVTGGGDFFLAFATALLGKSRGGPAKVAIISSGFFGSLSGSVISNVVTTGKITIPTMKRAGYPPAYAGAVEACASTGGALMPPVMGAVAFLMAENLNMPYADIIIAAAVPAFLFYLALLLQVDNYAAKVGLKGQPAEEIPNLWKTFISGWHYLFSLAALIYMLLVLRIEVFAPYFATLILIATSVITSLVRGEKPFGFSGFIELLIDAGKTIVNIVGILVGIGMIIGALSITGVGPAFSSELLRFAEGSVFLLLGLGAITSFVLGMGMTVSACYIFLAVVMGGAMVDSGLHPVAGHLFILYWGMMSYITPPVAVAAVAASTIAQSPAMETGFRAMRLGGILFVLPFLFAINPTLILEGELIDIVHDVFTAIVAVWMLASAFEGWLYGAGRLILPLRVVLGLAALGTLAPGTLTDLIGLGVLIGVYAVTKFTKASSPTPTPS
jgi:TRAP transporter 4TM/12TM fusion protein